jgi:hypothetical protein
MDDDLQVRTYSPAMSLGHARRRAAVMLLVSTAIAAVAMALIFLLVLKGEWMTGMFSAIAHFMFGQPVWAILAATSPLAAALLVGFGYMQRGIARRRMEREAALASQAPTGERNRSHNRAAGTHA